MRRLALFLTLSCLACTKDPSAGLLQTKAAARNYDCQRLSQAEAHQRYPGVVPEPSARGFETQRDALICQPRFIDWSERNGRDETFLVHLTEDTQAIASRAAETSSKSYTWYVDAFFPTPAVASKIAVATRVSLFQRGLHVSDSVPFLAAGDVSVLARMPLEKAYPTACRRYFEEGSLTDQEAFLGVMVLDARETQLHAGVCTEGKWRWLQ